MRTSTISTPAIETRSATSSASSPATTSVEPRSDVPAPSASSYGWRVRDVAQRRLGLDGDEVCVVVHGVRRPRRVGDLPDDDGGDLDRVAVGVVDLEPVGLEVAHPDADPAADRQRQHPPEAGAAHGADVAAEELHDRRLPRRHDDERRGDEGERRGSAARAGRWCRWRADRRCRRRRPPATMTPNQPLRARAGRCVMSTRTPWWPTGPWVGAGVGTELMMPPERCDQFPVDAG